MKKYGRTKIIPKCVIDVYYISGIYLHILMMKNVITNKKNNYNCIFDFSSYGGNMSGGERKVEHIFKLKLYWSLIAYEYLYTWNYNYVPRE